MAPKISVVINVDTRPENLMEGEMGKGVVSRDFIIEGVENKIKFFKGFDIEVILFLDIHEPLHPHAIDYLMKVCDKVVLSKHKKWGRGNCVEKHNDYNYLHALSLAKGDYVAHFDMDIAAFTRNQEPILKMMQMLEEYSFVCYPSEHSPGPCHDDSFDYWWASTRFFICKKSVLDIGLVSRCLEDKSRFDKYFPSRKDLHWMEHILGRTVKRGSVIYPPFDLSNYAIWSWKSYLPHTLKALNMLSYDNIGLYINKCGGIFYPCDLSGHKEVEK